MKRNLLIWVFTAALTLLAPSCVRTLEENQYGNVLPDGTPITMRIDFGADDLVDWTVSTKAEATPADEERVHDLYVLIFCDGEGDAHMTRGQKIYGRYFSYEHLRPNLSTLDSDPNEGWWVENRSLENVTNPVAKTRGAVKISTKVCSTAKVVVIANVQNGVCKLGDQEDVLDYLNGIRTYDEFRQTQVKLTQDVVNRKDLFLMMGVPEDGQGQPKNVNTGEMVWGTTTPTTTYNSEYKIQLRPVDAKVKFKVRVNDPNNPEPYISAAKAVYWEVCNTPDRCYLFSDYDGGRAPDGTVYFGTEPAYFEGTVVEDGSTWYVFSFYMLESRHGAKVHATDYYQREKQHKTITDRTGYGGDANEHYVENGEWVYAMPNAPYVKFDMILTLTPAGVAALGGSVSHALTSDTIYTVHLGDFSGEGFDDYNTYRSTCYTYRITIANSGSIYAEVKEDREVQPGQEGYLLLTDDEIVNADSHYEYHAITFTYDPETTPEKFSWYVKTPFTSQVGGGPQKGLRRVNGIDYPVYDPHDIDGTLLDFLWLKFGLNETDEHIGYRTERIGYPGDPFYDPDWGVGEHGPWDTPHPVLMDISQLIQYIFEETAKERETPGSSDFRYDSNLGRKVIRATIFIDEYYYEHDPRDESGNPQPDPNLWRQFVNAQPREMHILSKTVQSRDRKSDVIESSHSVIQQSIQSIYNIYEPTLRSLWGCEHLDEIKYTTVDGQIESDPAGNWIYWPVGCLESERYGENSDIGKENGRLNTAFIWGLYNKRNNSGTFTSTRQWETFLNYEVNNRVPELIEEYHGMAWSCMTRNRDNNGNGKIDPEEVRWYMAASQQLAGLWVGRESLSNTARLYQPGPGQWRAHVMSSTDKRVAWSEEGAGATEYRFDYGNNGGGGGPTTDYHTWPTQQEAAAGESVRCIRNVGTYDDPVKGLTDITYAPVTQLPDKYFTVTLSDGITESDNLEYTDDDQYYIFHFDRLDTKSIREYSPGELPYHAQTSLNNRVYVKLETQPIRTVVDPYSVKNIDINNLVTQKGHNDYCPEGYRFPNHTEMLLMELYLKQEYMRTRSGGYYPTRTYYDRGYYGDLRSDTEPWSVEKSKVGWVYTDKMHCNKTDFTLTRARCVRDDDQTGVISGRIAVEGNTIYPGDEILVDFKFSSTASTFSSATLTLWYTKNGFRTPYDLTAQLKTPTGLQYKGTQYITMPTLDELGLSAAGLDGSGIDMTLEAEFSNLNNRSGRDELSVKMKNPIRISLDPDEHFYPADAQGGRFAYNISMASRTLNLSEATFKLRYTDQSGNPREQSLGSVSLSGKSGSGSQGVAIPSLSELGLETLGLNLNRTMAIEATVTTSDGLTSTASADLSLVSHLTGSSMQFPTAYDDADGIPVNVSVESVNDRASATSATFYWKRQGDAQYSAGTPVSGSLNTYVKDIIGSDLSESNKGKFYFYFTADCSDGTSITSDVWSMDILYYGKCWNPGPWDSNSNVGQINKKWTAEAISALDFAAGDFIDAYLDVTNCVYIRKDGTSNNDIGMDNLMSFGDSNASLEWNAGTIHFYYPAHSPNEAPGQDLLQIGVLHYGKQTIARMRPYTLDGTLTVRLQKDLLLVNGAEPDWSVDYTGPDGKASTQIAGEETVSCTRATISHITDGSTVKIGSVEGQHRSRATYKYVRVVRKESATP